MIEIEAAGRGRGRARVGGRGDNNLSLIAQTDERRGARSGAANTPFPLDECIYGPQFAPSEGGGRGRVSGVDGCLEKSFAAAEAAIPMIPSTLAIADGGDLGPLSARKKKKRTTMAIRVRSTFPPSRRTRRGIEPFVAGNDDRRNRMGGERKGEERGWHGAAGRRRYYYGSS